MTDLPVACTLSPDALKTRREGLLSDLRGRSSRERRALPGCSRGCSAEPLQPCSSEDSAWDRTSGAVFCNVINLGSTRI